MNHRHLLYVYVATSILVLAVLIWLTLATSPDLSQLLPPLLFGVLIVFTDTFGVRLPAGMVSLPNLLFYEGGPLIFAPLVALIYTRLGVVLFILFALLVTVSSLITRGLAITSQRLERRVKELGSLQAVGQALSASLSLVGLPFCKLTVEAHGGQIWVESEVGKGSTFIMRLPAKPET